jgi:hypothetical protein
MKDSVLLLCGLLISCSVVAIALAPKLAFTAPSHAQSSSSLISQQHHIRPLHRTEQYMITINNDDDDDDDNKNSDVEEEEEEEDDDDEEEEDAYTKVAGSEFTDSDQKSSALATMRSGLDSTIMDWGGALGKLRERVGDVESGLSSDPSHALFRMMSSESPNQVIGKFITTANPQVVQAMSGAVGSLLGGLSNPNMGVETVVKATGEKVGSLCFQLQMTG